MDQLSIESVCATLFCNELGANKLYRDEIIRKNSEESEGTRMLSSYLITQAAETQRYKFQVLRSSFLSLQTLLWIARANKHACCITEELICRDEFYCSDCYPTAGGFEVPALYLLIANGVQKVNQRWPISDSDVPSSHCCDCDSIRMTRCFDTSTS